MTYDSRSWKERTSDKIVGYCVIVVMLGFIGLLFYAGYEMHRAETIELVGQCPVGKHCNCIDNSCTLMEVQP